MPEPTLDAKQLREDARMMREAFLSVRALPTSTTDRAAIALDVLALIVNDDAMQRAFEKALGHYDPMPNDYRRVRHEILTAAQEAQTR